VIKMREVPVKVFALIGTEVGITAGMAVMLYFSLRSVIRATVSGQWKAFKEL
jgi:hypothetical protein